MSNKNNPKQNEAAPKDSFIKKVCNKLRSIASSILTFNYFYESPLRLFGLPLLSVNLGQDTPAGKMRKAKGILAVGTDASGFIAIGIFKAKGFFSIGLLGIGFTTISIAGVGVLSVCAFGIGLVSVSAVAVGYLAVGVIAIGYLSVGIVAVGWEAVGIVGIGEKINSLFHW
jgi:hypothetical protein